MDWPICEVICIRVCPNEGAETGSGHFVTITNLHVHLDEECACARISLSFCDEPACDADQCSCQTNPASRVFTIPFEMGFSVQSQIDVGIYQANTDGTLPIDYRLNLIGICSCGRPFEGLQPAIFDAGMPLW